MSIEVSGLTKIYGSQKAVDNISFKIPKGTIVGFLGPNGAGKSTTMKMLATYLMPNEGSAKVCGINVVENPLEVKRKIGFLQENNPLYYDMYVREYLSFVADIHKINDKKKRIEDIIQITGLSKESHKKVGALSKGYKQRVGLAQAMIHDPEVLILDEPTTGLDPNQILEIRSLIKSIGKEKTVLLSTHIMQEVEAMCDRIIIINDGKIVTDKAINQVSQLDENIHTITVSFDKPITPADVNEWNEFAQKISAINNGNNEWLIETPNPDHARKMLLTWSLKMDNNIVSMQSKELDLETVFRSVTSKDKK